MLCLGQVVVPSLHTICWQVARRQTVASRFCNYGNLLLSWCSYSLMPCVEVKLFGGVKFSVQQPDGTFKLTSKTNVIKISENMCHIYVVF